MENIKIKVKIGKDNNIYNASLNNNKIYFVDRDEDKTVNILDLKENTLKRDNNKYYLKLMFIKGKETDVVLEDKTLNKKLNMKLFTKSIKKSEKYIEIIYTLNEEEFKITIERVI